MAATAPLLSKSAKLLASTRLARLAIAIFAVRSFAEGSRRRHGVDDDKRDGDDRDVDRGRRGPPRHPAARSASSSGDGLDGRFSPDFDHRDDYDAVVGGPTDDDGDRESKSFFERNGLEPPPLVSRADRPGRALEAKTDDDGEDENGISDVELIMEEAKNGADAAARVRRDLIRPGRYDKHAYPWEYAWRGRSPGERTGVPVEFSINFHRVFGVDIINPVLDVIAWMRIEWVDPRLTWRPEEYGNLTKTWFWIGEGGAGGETSEIWTPDIELWNLEEGLRGSFDDAYAIVGNDGSVFWSRPGHLRPACKFRGLDVFPFDTLTCAMEFGSWTMSGKYLRLVKGVGGGFTIGGSETSGESFNEFSLAEEDPVRCAPHVYPPYPASPEEDWPVLMYDVTIRRSWQPYARGYLLTQVLLNVVGFSAFWLPPSCGERMGLSITAMLAAVAAEIVVAANLPAAAEYTWFQKFSLLSMSFACVSLLESVAVLYFYYKRSESMVPWWFTQLQKWYQNRRSETPRKTTGKAPSDNDYDPKYDDEDSFSAAENRDGENDASARNVPCRDSFEEERKDEPVKMADGHDDVDAASLELSDRDYGLIETKGRYCDSMISNLSFDGHKSNEKLNDRKAIPASDISIAELQPTIRRRSGTRRGDLLKESDETDSGRVSKTVSFSGVMNDENRPPRTASDRELPTTPRPGGGLSVRRMDMKRATVLQQAQQDESMRSIMVPRDADDFNNEEEVEHNKQWKHVAARIDDVARFWIPLAFVIAISIVLAEVL